MHPLIKRILKLFCASLVVLAMAVPALASHAPLACEKTNGNGNWSIVASAPTVGPCPLPTVGECTTIQYDIAPLLGKTPDHVVVLTQHDRIVVDSDGAGVTEPCVGDSVTDLGIHDCSTQAVRLNKNDLTQTYNLTVEGEAIAVSSSIVVKKGRTIEDCGIASLGTAPVVCDPKAQQSSKETFVFEDCEVEIEVDPCTGAPGDAIVVSGDCEVSGYAITDLELVINGVPQTVNVGDGWLSSGENSCTTRFYRRKPYVICDCTDASDPSPPCD
jgi:hypothetical protein